MPAEQRGQPYATSSGYGIRWYDETGRRRRQAGFKSKSAARSWFENVEKPRMRGEPIKSEPITLSEHVDAYLDAHSVGRDPKTIDVLRFRLGYATRVFGELHLHDLERRVAEIAAWTATLPAGSRHGIVQALRQALNAAVRWGTIKSNPAKLVDNPLPKRAEVLHFEPEAVEQLAEEFGATYGPLVVFAAHTGLRPGEWTALEWRDVDRKAGAVRVERAFSYGELKSTKTDGSVRRVPLPARALEALEAVPRRLDRRLVFPGPRGGHIDLRNWRKREWRPAVIGAGLWTPPPKGEKASAACPIPYTLRHSYAAWSLAAGVPAYDVARFMGTSLKMLDKHYGHLVQGSESAARARLDAFMADRSDRLGQEGAGP